MAYSSNESGRFEVYVTGFPGGGAKWQASANGGSFPLWRRDGRELFLLDAADNLMAVEVNIAGDALRMGTPQALLHVGGVQTQQGPYAVTGDGKKSLINTGDVKEENQPFTLVQNWVAELKKSLGNTKPLSLDSAALRARADGEGVKLNNLRHAIQTLILRRLL